MNRTATTRRSVIQRVAPIVLVGVLGVGAAACGSSGTKTQPGGQSPTPTTSSGGSGTTSGGSSSGGAGF